MGICSSWISVLLPKIGVAWDISSSLEISCALNCLITARNLEKSSYVSEDFTFLNN